MKTILQIAKEVSMINSTRHVNIRGYVKEVKVSHKDKNGEYVCFDGNKIELVPQHLFYHEGLGGLQLRDDVEFKRRYPNHPIEIIKLPTL